MGSRADRGRRVAGRARHLVAALRPLHAAGRDRGGACRSGTADATDWEQIVGLYDVLLRADPSPVIELNRAAAMAMRDGPAAGLAIVDAILARGDSTAITSRTRPAPICAAGWEELNLRVRPISARWNLRARSRKSVSWRKDYGS